MAGGGLPYGAPMTTFEDLAPVASPFGAGTAVGWLGRGVDVPRSGTPPRLVRDLEVLAARPENVMRGLHDCELCGARSPLLSSSDLGERVVQGTGEIWVEDGDTRFVAPTLVVHHVERHGYCPPARFVRAAARAADDRRRSRPRG